MYLQHIRRKFFASRTAQRAAALLILPLASLTAHAAKVVITVNGTVTVGGDMYGIFGIGKDLGGKPFTLIYTFDDAHVHKGDAECADSVSTASGSNPAYPASAVLNIGKGSFTFGNLPNSTWAARRELASDCGPSVMLLSVNEGQYPQIEGFQLKLISVAGKPPITTSADWHSPLHATDFDSGQNSQSFMIVHPGDYMRMTQGVLEVKSVTIQ